MWLIISAHSTFSGSLLRSRNESLCFNWRYARIFSILSSLIYLHFLDSFLLHIKLVIFLTGSRYIHLYGRFNYMPYTVKALDNHEDVISTLRFIVDPSSIPSGEIEFTSYPNRTEEPWSNTTSPPFPYPCHHFMWVHLTNGCAILRKLFPYFILYCVSLL